jgi:hypothetical protein
MLALPRGDRLSTALVGLAGEHFGRQQSRHEPIEQQRMLDKLHDFLKEHLMEALTCDQSYIREWAKLIQSETTLQRRANGS